MYDRKNTLLLTTNKIYCEKCLQYLNIILVVNITQNNKITTDILLSI